MFDSIFNKFSNFGKPMCVTDKIVLGENMAGEKFSLVYSSQCKTYSLFRDNKLIRYKPARTYPDIYQEPDSTGHIIPPNISRELMNLSKQ